MSREGPRLLGKADHDLSFWSGAACRGQGTAAFFGPGEKSNPDEVPDICLTCPVQTPCGEHGLHHERDGSWGGMTQKEMRVIRLERGIRLPRL